MKTFYVVFILAMIIFHGYVIFYMSQTIYKSAKIIKINGNSKYFVKTWKVILRHKSMCIYSFLFLIFVLVGIKIAKEDSLLNPSNKDSGMAMLPGIIHIFVLRYIFAMSTALNIRAIACGQKKHILFSMLASSFYYYPVYLWERFRAHDILRDNVFSFQIKAICYVLEREKYKSSIAKAEILKKRFYLFGVEQVLEIPVFLYVCIILLFSIELFEIWYCHSILALIYRSGIIALITVSMFIETLAVIYVCQLYFWNQKWEETYSGILSQGRFAPNIKTIEFPELN